MKLRVLGTELVYLTPVVLTLWIAAFFLGRHNKYSAFLDEEWYGKKVAREHEQQRTSALRAFEDLKQRVPADKTPLFDKGTDLCVAILSMSRRGSFQHRYLTRLVMSLVTRMSWNREDISISILNMETNPADHTEANELGKYFRVVVPKRDTSGIPQPEEQHSRNYYIWKETVDYMAALETVKHCRHSLVLEDDALAALNWDEKVEEVIKELKDKSKEVLYTKLFFSYTFLGWGLEWQHFVTLGALAIATALLISFLVGTYISRIKGEPKNSYELCEGQPERSFVSPRMLGPVSSILLIANFVAFYHAIGRQHLLMPSKGLHHFDLGFGMVAVLYQQSAISSLIDFYRNYLKTTPPHLLKPKDLSPNIFKTESGLKEFVFNPSIFQHCGVHSSLKFKLFDTAPRDFTLAINFEDDEREIKFEK